MARRRSNIEIVAEILQIANKRAKKTRIVYGANLNFKMLGEYLERLEKAGLIKGRSGNEGFIEITDKGKEYLRHFRGFRGFGI